MSCRELIHNRTLSARPGLREGRAQRPPGRKAVLPRRGQHHVVGKSPLLSEVLEGTVKILRIARERGIVANRNCFSVGLTVLLCRLSQTLLDARRRGVDELQEVFRPASPLFLLGQLRRLKFLQGKEPLLTKLTSI